MCILTEIFVVCDDFYSQLEKELSNKLLENGKLHNNRKSNLSISEIMAILIYFHTSSYRNFKHYYCKNFDMLIKYFPNLVSYNRFVELKQKALLPITLLVHFFSKEATGIYFIDSTPIRVCNIKRASSNKVFKGIAKKSKSSTGWFFGMKLHVVANDKGEIMSFSITAGNKDDRKPVTNLTKNLFGKLVGDKGYLSQKLFDELLENGLHLITKIKKNMKNILMPLYDKILLRKRAIIESIFDQLKNISQIEHTRHRSPTNFLVNIVSGLAAYCFQAKKPSLKTSYLIA